MTNGYILVMQGKNLLEGSMTCKFNENPDFLDADECFTFTEKTSEKITGQTKAAVGSGTLTQILVGATVIWPK